MVPQHQKYPKLHEPGWLEKELQTRTYRQIADEIGCTPANVIWHAKAWGLETSAQIYDKYGNKLCGAKNRNKDTKRERCTRPAGWGTDNGRYGPCKLHLGKTKRLQHKAALERAEDIKTIYGLPIETTATEALEGELKRTAGHVAWLQTKIAHTAKDEDLTEVVGGAGGSSPSTEESIWLRMYARERKHLTDVAKACHAVGIDERRVQLAEQQGQLLAQAVQGMLRELGVENDPRTPQIVRKYLMLAQGGEIEGEAVEIS
jgi:hypothetical protein